MAEYTPTADEIAEAIEQWAWSHRPGRPELLTVRGVDALAAHDAEVRAEALAPFKSRHRRQNRPNLAGCTCNAILCPELAILEGGGSR